MYIFILFIGTLFHCYRKKSHSIDVTRTGKIFKKMPRKICLAKDMNIFASWIWQSY